MPEPPRSRRRRRLGATATAVGALLLWLVLALPDRPDGLSVWSFAVIPVEGVVLVACALVLPRRARAPVTAVLAGLVAVMTLVKVLDLGFLLSLYRPFDPLSDLSYAGPALGLARDSLGSGRALVLAAGTLVLVLLVLVGVPVATVRLVGTADRHRGAAVPLLTVLAVAWTIGAALPVQLGASRPLASTATAAATVTHVRQVQDGIRDRGEFARATAQDPYASLPPQDLLTGLRGKDVVIAIVESYGRVAVEDPAVSPPVRSALDAASNSLAASGFSARSAFLTSPTFGGLSWLAHSTLQSGLRIDTQVRYDALLSGQRVTLSSAFAQAGWRTVLDSPANRDEWAPARTFYHNAAVYGTATSGYAGPSFGYAPVPDQYTLAEFSARELTAGPRQPVMAEIDLVSSHTPWAPLPQVVAPAALGDGSVFTAIHAAADSPEEVWPDPARVRAAYAASVAYTIDSLASFVANAHDDNLVLIILGDHQPATIVSGVGASHDVPVTVVAHDRSVLDRISTWNWPDGMTPRPDAPVWPMEAFRDRFLTAYSR